MGMRDVLADDYGRADGGKRLYLWRQMAACTCAQCDEDMYFQPDFGME